MGRVLKLKPGAGSGLYKFNPLDPTPLNILILFYKYRYNIIQLSRGGYEFTYTLFGSGSSFLKIKPTLGRVQVWPNPPQT